MVVWNDVGDTFVADRTGDIIAVGQATDLIIGHFRLVSARRQGVQHVKDPIQLPQLNVKWFDLPAACAVLFLLDVAQRCWFCRKFYNLIKAPTQSARRERNVSGQGRSKGDMYDKLRR